MFEGNVEKSRQMPRYFEGVAKANNVAYFDAGTVARSSEEDGLHLQADQHENLGKAVAREVKKLLP